MAKKRRTAEYYEEDDTKLEIDSQEQEETEAKAKSEEDLVKLLEQISKQQLIEIILSVSSENKKFTEEIHKLAAEALNEQVKMLGNQMTACILASPPEEPQQQMMIVKRNSSREDKVQRKIFVGNVIDHPEITSVKLFKFFSKYGEIAEGPHGFDKKTGEPKGFAIFMYKTVEGARKALENPIKNFYGHPLYCERANGASPNRNDECTSVGSSPRAGAGFNAQIGVIGRRGFVDQGDINGGSGITKLKSGSNGLTRKLPLKSDDCNGVGSSSSRAGAGFDAQIGVIGRRVFLDQGGSGSNKLKSGSNDPSRNLALKNNGVGSSSPRAGAGAWSDAQNEIKGRRVFSDQGDINGGSGTNKVKSGSNGRRMLSLKNDAHNHGGNSPQAGDGAGFSAQNGVMGRRVLQDQWDCNSFFDRQWDNNSGAQLYGRGKEPIQRRQLDASCQIRPSGYDQAQRRRLDASCQIRPSRHDQTKRPTLARAGASVVCIGHYLDKLVLFILCLLGVLFLLSVVYRS